MSVRILVGDVIDRLAELPADSVDCVVTSPPYWGLRDYGVDGQIGMEPTLGEHLDVMVRVFDAVRRVMKPEGTLWLNYGDCYATKPNGRSAAATKAAGTDDRTFRDKPFSTVGGTLKPKDLCMVPNRLAIALQDAGWWVRSEIVWGKPNPMPDSSGRYRPSTAHEKLFLLTKSAKSFYDSEAVRMPPADATVSRLAQDIEHQAGSDRANANGKTNGRMKAVGRRQGGHPTSTLTGGLSGRHETPDRYPEHERRDKQRGHTRVHEGLRDRWDDISKAEQQANGRLLRNYEPDLSPIIPPEVWEIATAAFSDAHFATFPPALVVPCILGGCPTGGTVLDPFGGAGTTGLVADRLGRGSILIELNPEYAEIARRRMESDQGMFADVQVAA